MIVSGEGEIVAETEPAEREAETRRRIVEATVALHTSVGPARTTISAIADKAGVQRHTVYSHFPEEDTLFEQIDQLAEAVPLRGFDADLQLLLGYQLLGVGSIEEAAALNNLDGKATANLANSQNEKEDDDE